MPNSQHQVIIDLLALPTAPFAEHHVIQHIRDFCEARNLKVRKDRAGNLLVNVRQRGKRVARPVCITAHMDHPGFLAERMTDGSTLRAQWRGGVPKPYFAGSGVRFFVDGSWVKGRVKSVTTVKRNGISRVDKAKITVKSEVPRHSIGMWDLPDPQIRKGKIYARACDDLAGAAAMLMAMDQLVKRKLACDAYFLFTRAEEVGFVGAIAAAKNRTIPGKCVVVAMETSSELPHARMGDGPILRVGDRASTFTPQATAFCHRVARQLAADDKKFQYQRKLMDGGTCESSAYCNLGYEATGLCVALGNYHNCNVARTKIDSEYVSLGDLENVVRWFVELSRGTIKYTGRDELLTKQIKGLEKTYAKLIASTVKRRDV